MPIESFPDELTALKAFFEEKAERIQNHRRELHKIPELGFSETETAAYIQRILGELGISYVSGVGKTGIVAKIGESGPRVAVRADMDGLPITEENECQYKSRHEGCMHACGHDAHAAMLLGVAEYFKRRESELKGQTILLIQPAEERSDGNGLTGARYMLNSGLLEGVSAILGMHVMSESPSGKFGIIPGPVMASGDLFRATIHGKGGHDAMVNQTVDPIYLTTQVLSAIYAIRSRKISPISGGTLSVGTVEAGTTANVIPDRANISGTIRTFDSKVRDTFVAELKKALKIAEVLDGSYELEMPFHVPETKNAPNLAAAARNVCIALFGQDSLYDLQPSMAVEDFSWYSLSYPSMFITLGTKIDDGMERPHHNPTFDIDDSVLYKGATLLAATALKIMETDDESARRIQ